MDEKEVVGYAFVIIANYPPVLKSLKYGYIQDTAFQHLDEVSSPDNNYAYSHREDAGGVGDLLEVGFTNTPSNAYEITEVHFYVFCGMMSTRTGSIYIAPRIGSLLSEDYNAMQSGYDYYYKSEDWFGSWTKAQIDAMSFRIRIGSLSYSSARVWVEQIYVDITYSILTVPATPSTPTASESTCYDGTSRLSFS